MNISQQIRLRAAGEYFETRPVQTPIPTAHPPSLKNPTKVAADLPQDGWKKRDSKKKKKRARKDLKRIMDKTLRQGRPTMVRHAVAPDPNMYWPPVF